jgi:hypothetical protein
LVGEDGDHPQPHRGGVAEPQLSGLAELPAPGRYGDGVVAGEVCQVAVGQRQVEDLGEVGAVGIAAGPFLRLIVVADVDGVSVTGTAAVTPGSAASAATLASASPVPSSETAIASAVTRSWAAERVASSKVANPASNLFPQGTFTPKQSPMLGTPQQGPTPRTGRSLRSSGPALRVLSPHRFTRRHP